MSYANQPKYPGTPTRKPVRLMTEPSSLVPPPKPSTIDTTNPPPSPGRAPFRRPPSPLRNSTTASEDGSPESDRHTQDEFEDDDGWMPESPTSSLSRLASSLAQRVGFGGTSRLPTDAELEAEAERERELSRREAERILTREAEERRRVEERVLALLDGSRNAAAPPVPARETQQPLPPAPPSQPSLSSSPKDTPGWWAAAKARLTPTKEKDPLTPAQQIIQEAKIKEKKEKKTRERTKEQEWPASAQTKYADPAFQNLTSASPGKTSTPPNQSPARSQNSTPRMQPSAPIAVPNRPTNNTQLTPTSSPGRQMSSMGSPAPGEPPMYAVYTSMGTLDIEATLMAIAKRFEKLEKWSVGHVRALEERMSDVEKWLVEKEEEKERDKERGRKGWQDSDDVVTKEKSLDDNSSVVEAVTSEMGVMRDELDELRGRVGLLGKEMARLAAAPPPSPALIAAPPAAKPVAVTAPLTPIQTPQVGSAQTLQPTIARPEPVEMLTPSPESIPTPLPQQDEFEMVEEEEDHLESSPEPVAMPSPPPAPATISVPARAKSPPAESAIKPLQVTRSLPSIPRFNSPVPLKAALAPTIGDYSSASDRSRSPSPHPSSTSSYFSARSQARTKLPYPTGDYTLIDSNPRSPTQSPGPSSSEHVGRNRPTSQATSPVSTLSRSMSPVASGLPMPQSFSNRPGSASPNATPRKRYTVALGGPLIAPPSPIGSSFGVQLENAFQADVPDLQLSLDDKAEETVGRKQGAVLANSTNINTSESTKMPTLRPKSTSGSPSNRSRAISSYGFPTSGNGPATPSTIAAGIRPRIRSQSTGRTGLGIITTPLTTPNGGKFVDPLVIRKKERDSFIAPKTPVQAAAGKPKVPIDQLVKFFDAGKK
ncbi:hypothetical protein SISSUDRAFT_1057745 [Sistotremastrum suecicum HHB10207 ss-3]|uniref:Uncharacterized protein n=1 Tax=Sistotremastrum suecicum HHB10207 ss-3 TaxID=1314776 RepID=A0A166I2Z2_9AGAM|nr:hypothetical protein SISSUDRAFT_1057745 [Sistotremastrum suecicum HHB10207 ss-3]